MHAWRYKVWAIAYIERCYDQPSCNDHCWISLQPIAANSSRCIAQVLRYSEFSTSSPQPVKLYPKQSLVGNSGRTYASLPSNTKTNISNILYVYIKMRVRFVYPRFQALYLSESLSLSSSLHIHFHHTFYHLHTSLIICVQSNKIRLCIIIHVAQRILRLSFTCTSPIILSP